MLSIIGGQPDPEPEAFYNSMYDVLKAKKVSTVELLHSVMLVDKLTKDQLQLGTLLDEVQFSLFKSKFRSWWEKNIGMFYLLKGKTCLQTAR